MHKKLEILRILNNMMLPYVMACVLFICAGMNADSALFAGNLLLMVFVVISEAVQYLCSEISLFLLGHLGGIAFCTFLSSFSGTQHMGFTIVRVVFMIAMTMIAINARLGKGVYFYPSIPEAFLFAALMIACKLAKSPEAELTVLLGEIFWGILAVIFYNTRQTAAAISVFKDRSRVPYESILKTNRLMLGIYLGIASVTMLICVLFDYGEEIMSAVKSVVVRFLRWLFSFFDFTVGEEEYVPPTVERQDPGMGILPVAEDDSIVRIIWDVLFWSIAIVVSIGFLIVLIKAIIWFIGYFNEGRIGIKDRLARDKVEYLSPAAEGKSASGDLLQKNHIPLASRLTARGQIRLLYKRYVQKGRGYQDVKKSHTPSQQLEASRGGYENNVAIKELYEKARYGEAEVSSEEVKAMRKMSR